MPPTTDDRRDSQRVPFKFLVREPALGGSFEEKEGNLAIGGVYFAGGHPPVGARVEVRFIVPGHDVEIEARGEVVRVSRDGEKFGAHIRFTEIPVQSELALARFFQARQP
jgi:hypothetical protein